MPEIHIDNLPEEIILHIFGFLDLEPPSERKARQEPNLSLTTSADHPLKDISCVSPAWRRISSPLLFKHARLLFDDDASCPLCGSNCSTGVFKNTSGLPQSVVYLEDFHQTMAKDFYMPCTGAPARWTDPRIVEQVLNWSTCLFHALARFLIFVQARQLESCVESFVFSCDGTFTRKLSVAELDGRRFPAAHYPASAAFWHCLLSVIDPTRIAILAPPIAVAYLSNASIETRGDWAFSDMERHILELKHQDLSARRLTRRACYDDLDTFPLDRCCIASSSVLGLRPWSHIAINEGSFLRAYSTYEFFERGPPSLVQSIHESLGVAMHGRRIPAPKVLLPAIRSFTYTAIFPFSNHVDFRPMIQHLEQLDVQFAADPQSGILDDKSRIQRADLLDCWQELMDSHLRLSEDLCTSQISDKVMPKMKRFVCRDYRIEALRDDLDRIFTSLCLPVWAETTPGVFTRVAPRAEYGIGMSE